MSLKDIYSNNIANLNEEQPVPFNETEFDEIQIAKPIYLKGMNAMKHILLFGEAQWGDRNSPTYRYFKKVVMDETYNNMASVFEELAEKGLIQKCSCNSFLRNGYNKKCPTCCGSGYCNTEDCNGYFGDVVYDGNVKE